MSLHLKCPRCNYAIDSLAAFKWGKDVQPAPLVPLICGGCAVALVFDTRDSKLLDLPDKVWKLIEKENPDLWEAIQYGRRQVAEARAKVGPPPGVVR